MLLFNAMNGYFYARYCAFVAIMYFRQYHNTLFLLAYRVVFLV